MSVCVSPAAAIAAISLPHMMHFLRFPPEIIAPLASSPPPQPPPWEDDHHRQPWKGNGESVRRASKPQIHLHRRKHARLTPRARRGDEPKLCCRQRSGGQAGLREGKVRIGSVMTAAMIYTKVHGMESLRFGAASPPQNRFVASSFLAPPPPSIHRIPTGTYHNPPPPPATAAW